MLASFSASGLPIVLSRKIAEDNANGGKCSNRYLSASVIISLSISAFLIVCFYLLRTKLEFIFSDERAMPLFLIMLPALLSTSVYSSIRSWFWGNRDYNAFSFTEMLEEILRILFSILFAGGFISFIGGAKGIALAFTLSDFACAIVLILIFYKKKGRFQNPTGYRQLLKSGLPLTAMRSFNGLINSLTALIIPALLITYGMASHDATANYGRVAGMAMPLLMAPTTLTGALAIVLIPEIAVAGTRNNKGYLKSRIDGSLLFSIFISSLFCILYIPLGREVAELVFNDSFAGEFLSNSALLLFPIGLNQISMSMLNSLGLEKKTFYNYLIGTSTLIICLFALPKYVGIYAMPIGSGICYTITSILNIKMLSKRVELGGNLKKTALAVIFMPICCIFAYLLKNLFLPFMPKFLAVLFAGGIPMATYLTLAVVFDIISLDRFYQKRKPKTKISKLFYC